MADISALFSERLSTQAGSDCGSIGCASAASCLRRDAGISILRPSVPPLPGRRRRLLPNPCTGLLPDHPWLGSSPRRKHGDEWLTDRIDAVRLSALSLGLLFAVLDHAPVETSCVAVMTG
jgi:hypothetical protein